MYKLFLTIRYLRKRHIVFFAIAAVTLCTAMVLVVMSVMGGWLDMVQNRARGLLGDIIVDNRSYQGFPLYDEFIAEIRTWPEVAAATPVIYSYGLLRFPASEITQTVQIVGVRLHEVYEVNNFRAGLYYERFYPDTTTFAEQQQPLVGIDPAGQPHPAKDGNGFVKPLALPEPYQSALQSARRAHGKPLDDPESVDSQVNELLRENDIPIIPGEWLFDRGLEDPPPRLAGEPRPGLIIGRDIVAERKSDARYERYYPKGEELTLTLWATSSAGNVDPVPIKKPFRYADDSRTGIYEIDSRHVYCDFDLLQQLLHMDAAERADGGGRAPARCKQIQVKTKPGADYEPLAERMTRLYRSYAGQERFGLSPRERQLVVRVEAQTWQQSQAHIIGPVQKEKNVVTILFGIVSLVAVALVLCILYMIVLQKTRDIGIVKAVGGSSSGVAAIWMMYGAAVGFVGGALGVAVGVLFVRNINEIQDLLVRINPSLRVYDLQVYSFDRIPDQVEPATALAVFAVAVFASTIGSLAAALRAGYMEPVGALGYE